MTRSPRRLAVTCQPALLPTTTFSIALVVGQFDHRGEARADRERDDLVGGRRAASWIRRSADARRGDKLAADRPASPGPEPAPAPAARRARARGPRSTDLADRRRTQPRRRAPGRAAARRACACAGDLRQRDRARKGQQRHASTARRWTSGEPTGTRRISTPRRRHARPGSPAVRSRSAANCRPAGPPTAWTGCDLDRRRRLGAAAIAQRLEPERIDQPVLEAHRRLRESVADHRDPRLRRSDAAARALLLRVEADDRRARLEPRHALDPHADDGARRDSGGTGWPGWSRAFRRDSSSAPRRPTARRPCDSRSPPWRGRSLRAP